VCVLYPIPPLRRLPLRAAESLAAVAAVNRLWVLVYVVGVFVVLPLCGWLLWGGTSG
jgi:sodium-dependent phosphate cotransporter